MEMETISRLLAELRKKKNWSLRQMAAHAGCSASFLSQIERGKTSPSLDSLERICGALDLTVLEFLAMRGEKRDFLFREGCAPAQLVSKWNRATLHHLFHSTTQVNASVLILELQRGGRTAWRAATRAMHELGVIVFGTVLFETDGGSPRRMRQGDAVYFDLARPHRWTNETTGAARVLLFNPNFTEVNDLPRSRTGSGKARQSV